MGVSENRGTLLAGLFKGGLFYLGEKGGGGWGFGCKLRSATCQDTLARLATPHCQAPGTLLVTDGHGVEGS